MTSAQGPIVAALDVEAITDEAEPDGKAARPERRNRPNSCPGERIRGTL
jgi:hypothetical protein